MIDEFDEEDVVLKQFLGDRFVDETEKPIDETEEHRDSGKELSALDRLKACTKTALIYGGLNTLLFYWQQAGLMDSSIAVPSMCVVCCLLGLGIGKVVGGK